MHPVDPVVVVPISPIFSSLEDSLCRKEREMLVALERLDKLKLRLQVWTLFESLIQNKLQGAAHPDEHCGTSKGYTDKEEQHLHLT